MSKPDKKIRVAIGPLTNREGGVGRVTRNISKFSKNDVKIFKTPALSRYFYVMKNRYNLRLADFYGIYLRETLVNNFDIIQLMGHPAFEEVFKIPNNIKRPKYIYRIPGFWFVQTPDFFINPNRRDIWRARLDKTMLKLCRQADSVVVLTPWFRDYIKKRFNINSEIIGNSVDCKKWDKGIADDFERKYGIERGFCLFAGQLRKDMDPSFFLELASRFPENEFVMIGRHVTVNNVEKYCNRKIPPNVKCLGFFGGQDLLNIFVASKIVFYAAPSIFGGNVVMEAMASGSIALRSHHAKYPDDDFFFKDGVSGLLYEENNIRDCSEKLHVAWENNSIGAKAKEVAIQKHDWHESIKKFDALYSQLVKS